MAKFRPIYTKIWDDPDFIDYPPEDKLLFIYLCTNHKTNESGIYNISIKTIATDTGIIYESVMQRFNNCLITDGNQIINSSLKNVYYDIENKLIFIRKFLKYNGGGNPQKVRISILSDLNTI
jgi:hypothetical protein